MKKLILFSLFFSFSFECAAQMVPADKWTAAEIKAAAATNDCNCLDTEEREALQLINLVRLYPKRFIQLVFEPYIKAKFSGESLSENILSLKQELMALSPLPALAADKTLQSYAASHAGEMGSSGKVGHKSLGGKNFAQRLAPIREQYGTIGENCDYGFDNATDTVLRMLIDDGVEGLGHRHNILDPKFSLVGISFQPHKAYTVNSVMIFAQKSGE